MGAVSPLHSTSWLNTLGSAVWRHSWGVLKSGPLFAWQLVGHVPERVLLVPDCLTPADKEFARNVYIGRYDLAGISVETSGHSPFLIDPPSFAWAQQLHAFGWLRHLMHSGSDLASANARALIDDWIVQCGRGTRGVAWQPAVTSRRLISWLQHAQFILAGSDHRFYRRFMRQLGQTVRYLRAVAKGLLGDSAHADVRVALAFASVCLPASQRFQRASADALDQVLQQTVLPDGGHASRNGDELVTLMLDLKCLRRAYDDASVAQPAELGRAMDRMLPALRALVHADGTMAHFNSGGLIDPQLIALALEGDHESHSVMKLNSHSGYERLSSEGTIVLADIGTPPPAAYGASAFAGCLSMEVSSDGHKLITNAGPDRSYNLDNDMFEAATAAHCALVVDDTSTARFGSRRLPGGGTGRIMKRGVRQVIREDWGDDGWSGFRCEQDGYVAPFGLLHERGIRLSDDGSQIAGFDRLRADEGVGPSKAQHTVDIRFHLPPDVEPTFDGETGRIVLAPSKDNAESWMIYAEQVAGRIEESVYFAGPSGPQMTRQVVFTIIYPEQAALAWHMRKMSGNSSN